MGSFTYPVFAVCVVIYNIVAALSTFLCSWLTPVMVPEKTSAAGLGAEHYSLLVVDEKGAAPLFSFPGARLQNVIPSNIKEQLGPIDSRMESMEIQSFNKENKNVAT